MHKLIYKKFKDFFYFFESIYELILTYKKIKIFFYIFLYFFIKNLCKETLH